MDRDDEYGIASELLRALAAPQRIAIVNHLEVKPHCVHELVAALGESQPLVSQHLRVLRLAGLVRSVRRGRKTAYSLTEIHVASVIADVVAIAAAGRVPAEAAARRSEMARYALLTKPPRTEPAAVAGARRSPPSAR